MFSLDFTGLCSHNTLNLWISSLVCFILVHAIVEVVILVDPEDLVDYTSVITKTWPVMMVFAVYPLVLAILSVLLLVHNLLFDASYPVMCVWHRNSIIKLI
jgi:hypothetical protein